jgi:hypothetical protein
MSRSKRTPLSRSAKDFSWYWGRLAENSRCHAPGLDFVKNYRPGTQNKGKIGKTYSRASFRISEIAQQRPTKFLPASIFASILAGIACF